MHVCVLACVSECVCVCVCAHACTCEGSRRMHQVSFPTLCIFFSGLSVKFELAPSRLYRKPAYPKDLYLSGLLRAEYTGIYKYITDYVGTRIQALVFMTVEQTLLTTEPFL